MAETTLAVVIGGAGCVWDDFDAAWHIITPRAFDVVACNDAGKDYEGDLAAMCSLHPEKLGGWAEQRKKNGYPPPKRLISHRKHRLDGGAEAIQEVFHGSSGLYAAQLAILHLGYQKVVLCGCPMTAEGAHYFKPDKPWQEANRYRSGWTEAAGSLELGGKIRSMSGWTRSLFGPPTTEWLDEVRA